MNMSAPLSRSLVQTIFFLCAVMLSPWSAAQDLDFHPPATVADATTPAVMRDLAERVLPVYQESDPERYLRNVAAIQLVAGHYATAYATRQALGERRRAADARRPVGRGLLLDIYARAKSIEDPNRLAFAQAYTQAYREVVPKLSDRDAYALSGLLEIPVAGFQEAIQKSFDQYRPKGTIALTDAVELIGAYLSFDAYRSFGPLVASLDAEENRRRYTTDEDVQIQTPGGATLSATVVRPKGASGRLPTLLEYTADVGLPNYAIECAAHGYVGVVAYARGRLKPTGSFVPFQDEGNDVRAVIAWAAAQSWSDGRVGMYGGSFSGFAQWAAAKQLPRALKAIATSASIAPGIDVPMLGGIFQNSAYRWSYDLTNTKPTDDALWRTLDENWYMSGRAYRDLDSISGKRNRLFTRWLNHPSYDLFWQKLIPYREEFSRINIPVLAITGYYASSEVGTLYYFTQHYRYDSHANHTLLIGPYDDGAIQFGPVPVVKGYSVDRVALIDLHALRYEWFDSVFKGEPKPDLLRARVNYEVMGANQWRHAASVESMARGSQRYYLEAKVSGDGHLLSQRKTSDAFVRQTVNLADRADFAWTPPGSVVGRDLQSHYGVTFISEPLKHSVEVNGLFSGRLDFTVNKLDVDLYVTIYELLPSGDYVQLFDPSYSFRASYAHERIRRHLLKAGERQQLTFRSERMTSRLVGAGSRLVVVLGVNKRPDQEINYGLGQDVSTEALADNKDPVKIRWYSSSYLDIPVHR